MEQMDAISRNLRPTRDRLLEAFILEDETGRLFWREPSKYHKEKQGGEAGSLNQSRWVIKIDGGSYGRSQIVFCMTFGYWPEPYVKHINGDPADDRPCNLLQSDKRRCGIGEVAIRSRYQSSIGKTFNHLTLNQISDKKGDGNRIHGDFICSCGILVTLPIGRVIGGDKEHCGCMTDHGSHRTHGMRYSGEYSSWQSMKARCLDPNNKDYPRWGGRGIEIFKPWADSFEEFYAHIGPRPEGASIDRIDNRSGYFPGNVRWASRSEQARNTCVSRTWFIKGKPFETLEDAAIHFSVRKQTIWKWVHGYFDARRNYYISPRGDCYAERKY